MEKIKPLIIFGVATLILTLIATGCSHNTGAFTIGTRVNAGLDPQNATANISYTDGLNVVDVSRENSSWDLEIDADNGVSVDGKSGTIKGVKRIRRDVGPQITGYLVDLAEKNPAMAENYVESMKYFWKFRAEQNSAVNRTTPEGDSLPEDDTDTITNGKTDSSDPLNNEQKPENQGASNQSQQVENASN